MNTLLKLTWVELKLFFRDPLSLVFTLVLPFFFLIVLNGVFGNEIEVDPEEDVWLGVGPADYYVPTYIGLVIGAIGILTLPVRLAAYRELGVLRRFHASAMPLWAVLTCHVIIAFTVAIVGAISITLASTFIYGTDLPKSFLLFVLAFSVSALSFSAFGVLLGSVMPTSRSTQGVGIMLFFLMFLLGGGGPPRDALSSGMRTVGDALPLTYVDQMLQAAWLQASWDTTASIVVFGVLVIASALSLRFFRWE